MEIELTNRYGFTIIVTADNVRIEEDIETREYPKDENGKVVFNKGCKRDIDTNALDQFAAAMSDMIYYREDEYDSSELIKSLFEKIGEEKRIELIKEMAAEYGVELDKTQ